MYFRGLRCVCMYVLVFDLIVVPIDRVADSPVDSPVSSQISLSSSCLSVSLSSP